MSGIIKNKVKMKPKFRITKCEYGFIVEYYQKTFFGGKWVHYISVAGIEDRPWYFKTYESAESEMLFVIKQDAYNNTYGDD